MANSVPTFEQQDVEKNKVIAALCFFGILFFLPLVSCPDSKFGKWAANQGLLVLIVSFVLGIISTVLGFIPFVGPIISWVLSLAWFVVCVLSIVAALRGEAKPLPFIGHIELLH